MGGLYGPGQSSDLMPSEMAKGEQAAWKQRLPLGRGFEGSCDPCKVGVWVEGPQVPMSHVSMWKHSGNKEKVGGLGHGAL